MRFGLVGTGPWAELAHGPGLVSAEGVELVGVWGRTLSRAEPLAQTLGVTAYDDYAALLADVEAVAFAVPPAVQAELALEAAVAGRHLLLDKPVATDLGAARTLLAAATEAGVSSVVFFTDRFVDETCAWIEDVRRGDEVCLVASHTDGATSTIALTQFAPPAASQYEATVWGEAGFSAMPPRPEGAFGALLARAAEELVACASSGQPHELDLRFGVGVVELLAQAQQQLDHTGSPVGSPR
jgi:hypothetical protein